MRAGQAEWSSVVVECRRPPAGSRMTCCAIAGESRVTGRRHRGGPILMATGAPGRRPGIHSIPMAFAARHRAVLASERKVRSVVVEGGGPPAGHRMAGDAVRWETGMGRRCSSGELLPVAVDAKRAGIAEVVPLVAAGTGR